ncbi:MAG: hypothetical protein Kow0098_18010 [Ignavibacteriaceae bacterium]
MVTFQNTWLPFIYLYGVGGIFFLSGMLLIRKTGGIDMSKKRHRYWWKVMIFGFFYFMALHAILILIALS